MSNERIFIIREQLVSDIVVVEHGSEAVTLGIWTDGEHKSIAVSPDQAEAIAKELIQQAARVREGKP
jgi:hypothetical protein